MVHSMRYDDFPSRWRESVSERCSRQCPVQTARVLAWGRRHVAELNALPPPPADWAAKRRDAALPNALFIEDALVMEGVGSSYCFVHVTKMLHFVVLNHFAH